MARVAECLGGAYEEAGEEELRHEEGGRHLLRHLGRGGARAGARARARARVRLRGQGSWLELGLGLRLG